MKTFNIKTPEEIYLEWLNEFVSIEAISEYYNVEFNLMYNKIIQGQEQYRLKYPGKE
jgi:hypothetical protein